jgi:hypothetical protein
MEMQSGPRSSAALLAGTLVMLLTAACSSAPAHPSAPGTGAPTSAVGSAAPTPPAAPSKDDDLARARRSLITTAELGKPWVAVKSVNSAGTKGEACPGQPTTDATVTALAEASADFTAGKQRGAAIGAFSVWTYAGPADVDTYRTTLPKVLAGCRSYTDTAKLYVVLTPAGTAAVDGADETWRYAERIYYDKKHTKLAYARHYVIARHGRVLSSVQYAFLTSKADPGAKDFAVAERMAGKQFARVLTAFSQS